MDTSTVVSPSRGERRKNEKRIFYRLCEIRRREAMASGSKYSDKDREEALAMLVIDTVSEVARKTGIPKQTLSTWALGKVKCTEKSSDILGQLRTDKKKEFIERSWRIIGKAQELLEEKLNADMALPESERKLKPTELTNITGIHYDKQALANNESTVNTNEKIEIVFSIPRPPKK